MRLDAARPRSGTLFEVWVLPLVVLQEFPVSAHFNSMWETAPTPTTGSLLPTSRSV